MSTQQENYITEDMDMLELLQALKHHIPKDWRIGQFIFNFLKWLSQKCYANSNTIFICKCACITEEEIKNCDCGCHDKMADPFYLEDDEIIKYWFQYLKEINNP